MENIQKHHVRCTARLTPVKFYKKNGDLFAFFPEDQYARDPKVKTSYAHVGQHGPCHVDYLKGAKKAKPEEYKDLANELESIGYNLLIK